MKAKLWVFLKAIWSDIIWLPPVTTGKQAFSTHTLKCQCSPHLGSVRQDCTSRTGLEDERWNRLQGACSRIPLHLGILTAPGLFLNKPSACHQGVSQGWCVHNNCKNRGEKKEKKGMVCAVHGISYVCSFFFCLKWCIECLPLMPFYLVCPTTVNVEVFRHISLK